MEIINGKQYPLWSQFVENKKKWVGGILEDFGDSVDIALGLATGSKKTEIIDITLEPSGDSAFFLVKGKDFGCGFNVKTGGISGSQEYGWITFGGYGEHKWRIKEIITDT